MNPFFAYLLSGLSTFAGQAVQTLEPVALQALEDELTKVLGHVQTAKAAQVPPPVASSAYFGAVPNKGPS